ncbi:MAG: cytochrome b N-terminal domain-containing protein [Anaerolineales bacterium]|nr:cytochrome b N-terminal domain-containing protein [Anaerolineales bacterium]
MKRKRPNFYLHLHSPKIPKREGSFFYTFGLGGISMFLLLWLGLTGLLEVFYYIPSAADANRSVQMITFLIPYGKLIRGIHYWAGQLLVVTTTLHMLRVVLTGSYKAQRSLNWLLGAVLLVVVLLFNFTGYALRWDEDISWALLVGTNLIKTIPLIGDSLYQIAVGSSSIGEQTIVRFYGWHIYGFAIIAGIFIVWHMFRVRRDGGISSRQDDYPVEKITRDELVEIEILAMFVVSIILIALALLLPPSLSGPADLNNIPEDATAPWFFIWVQQLLGSGDPLVMGVLIPVFLLALIMLVPFLLDRNQSGIGVWFNKEGRLAQITIILIIVSILILTLIKVL